MTSELKSFGAIIDHRAKWRVNSQPDGGEFPQGEFISPEEVKSNRGDPQKPKALGG